MSDLQDQLELVARFNESYETDYLESIEETRPKDDPFRLRFFLKRAMASARSESVSTTYRRAAESVLRNYEEEICDHIEGDGELRISELEEELEQEGLTNGADRKMVIGVIDLLCDINDSRDIINYTRDCIKSGDIDTIYSQLDNIHNIAHKKATLFLRDVVAIWDSEEELSRAEYRYVFPVDTQVRQVVTELGIVDSNTNTKDLISSTLDACNPDVSPVAFNQGAWYLGANAFDVLMENLDNLDLDSS